MKVVTSEDEKLMKFSRDLIYEQEYFANATLSDKLD